MEQGHPSQTPQQMPFRMFADGILLTIQLLQAFQSTTNQTVHEVRLFSASRHLRLACTSRRRRDGGDRGTAQRGPPDGPQVWRRRTREDSTCSDESRPVGVGAPRAKWS